MEIATSIITKVFEWLLGLLQFVLDKFPHSPFADILDTLEVLPYLGYLNYFCPIGTFITIGKLWLGAIAMYYIYSIGARWMKVL